MKRILVVDSDMAVRSQIGRHARLEGYEVAEASDGYTAVALCRQFMDRFQKAPLLLRRLSAYEFDSGLIKNNAVTHRAIPSSLHSSSSVIYWPRSGSFSYF